MKIQTLIKIAEKSGKILMKNYGKIKFIKIKELKSYVTNADLESEKYIISAIRKKYPSHDIVSEESGSLNKKSDYRWYIDPLDGTYNYINNIPLFGVSIALEYKGRIILGVVNLPYLKELYYAEKGKGAFLNGKRIKVSNRTELKNSLVLTGLVLRHSPKKMLQLINKLKGIVYDIRVIGSAVFDQTYVAKGSADIYLTMGTNAWDVAAGLLIIEEAGGKATNFKGNHWKPEKGDFLAANKNLHNKVLKILKQYA